MWHPPVQKTEMLADFSNAHYEKKGGPWPMKKGNSREDATDRTNLRILNFADNKDLHGGRLYESLTSAPVIDGIQLEMKIKPPLPTHFSNNVCLCILDFEPRLAIRFFLPVLYLAPSSPRHYFFASTLSFSFFHDDKRTNER
jgi:hypothetical protein